MFNRNKVKVAVNAGVVEYIFLGNQYHFDRENGISFATSPHHFTFDLGRGGGTTKIPAKLFLEEK